MPSKVRPSARRSHWSRPQVGWPMQAGGPRPDLVGGQQLPAAEHLDLVEVDGRALVGDRELGQPVDLVAPQVDAHRHVAGRGEHVDDRAPHRQLAPVLDLVLAAVAGAHQPGHQLLGSTWSPVAHHDGLDLLDVRARGAAAAPAPGPPPPWARGPAAGAPQPPHGAQPPAHGLDAGADPLEGQRLPGREQLDLVVAQEGGQVVGQALGLGGGGHGHHDRASGCRPAGQAGDGEGPGRLGHRQHGVDGRPRTRPAPALRATGGVGRRGRSCGVGRARLPVVASLRTRRPATRTRRTRVGDRHPRRIDRRHRDRRSRPGERRMTPGRVRFRYGWRAVLNVGPWPDRR